MGPEIIVSLLAALVSATASTEAVRAFVRRGSARESDLTLDSREIDALTQTLREELLPSQTRPRPGGTSDGPGESATAPTPAELEALAIMEVYGKELLAEAGRIAKRASADRPSKKHVRQAADRIGVLRDRAGVATDLGLAIGSILIGAAVSYQVNLWTGGQAAQGIGVWMTLALAVGVGVVVASATIKWRRS